LISRLVAGNVKNIEFVCEMTGDQDSYLQVITSLNDLLTSSHSKQCGNNVKSTYLLDSVIGRFVTQNFYQ
jgi:hypothetical protein